MKKVTWGAVGITATNATQAAMMATESLPMAAGQTWVGEAQIRHHLHHHSPSQREREA